MTKVLTDNQRKVRTRHNRGYNFEHKLEKDFNAIEGFHAKRLAPSSISLPDVIATYQSNLIALEAKATTLHEREIELEQLINGLTILDVFPLYRNKYIGGSFYFSRKSKDYRGRNIKRKIKLYTIIWEKDNFERLIHEYGYGVKTISCNYEGLLRFHLHSENRYDKLTKEHEAFITKKINKNYPHFMFWDFNKLIAWLKTKQNDLIITPFYNI